LFEAASEAHMSEWSREEIIELAGLALAALSLVAAVLAMPNLRRLVGLGGRDIWINIPRNRDALTILYDETILSGEHGLIVRAVSGEVAGYGEKEIERLGLFVEVLIKTDAWYPQGSAAIGRDRIWTKEAKFTRGLVNVVKAVLKDRHGNDLTSAQIKVTVP
jgi:hypothetical protein